MTADPGETSFYSLPVARQTARLAELAAVALGAWDVRDARIELVKYRENAVFAIDDPRGGRYALRIHRAGYRQDRHIRSEVAWMRALAEAGIRTPEVVPTRTGDVLSMASASGVPEPRQCDLLRWVPGVALGSLEAGVAGDDADVAEHYRLLGRLAARVHAHGAGWERPEGFERPAFDAEALVGETPVWGAFWQLGCLDSPQRSLLLEARDRTRDTLARIGTRPEDYGLIHGDFLPENVLMYDGEPLLIDFDDCGDSWFAFELATGLFPLLQHPRLGRVVGAYVEGYRSQRAFPEPWLGWLPTLLMARTLSYLGWPVGRPENEDAQRVAPLLAAFACDLARRYLAGESLGLEGERPQLSAGAV